MNTAAGKAAWAQNVGCGNLPDYMERLSSYAAPAKLRGGICSKTGRNLARVIFSLGAEKAPPTGLRSRQLPAKST